jgi:4-amino-4-deoxy-L-arabinose transferase-like glycosyltransferase
VTRKVLLSLTVVLLIQSILVARVFTPQPHSGGDNAGYVSLAYSLLDQGEYREIWDPEEPPHTKYPPVLPILLAGVMLLGVKGWAGLKLIPAFSTVLAVAFTFLWVRDRKGLLPAFIVALLFGLSESVLYYSQWILSDPTFLALTMAALWAFKRASATDSGAGSGGERGLTEDGSGDGRRWMALAMGMVVLAYFTRSAGLPLVVAGFLSLGLRKSWKTLGIFSVVIGIPALLWWLRGTMVGGSEYVSEFWLLDPYQPHLGTVGLGGLVQRGGENLVAYVTRIIPAGILGDAVPHVAPIGLGFALFSLFGWVLCLRERVGVAELFLPLYLGLVLLWPQAWSGDRFSLPLLPLMFFYTVVAFGWLAGSLPKRVSGVAAAVLLLLVGIPSGLEWNRIALQAGSCRDVTASGNSTMCLAQGQAEYFALAEWSGKNLPAGAAVTTRKPRAFFLMSGVKARSIPMVQGADEFLRVDSKKAF